MKHLGRVRVLASVIFFVCFSISIDLGVACVVASLLQRARPRWHEGHMAERGRD